MTRVSEGSSIHAINYSMAKTKEKLENLQLQGSNLKKVQRPSDDPVGNMEILAIRSKKIDGEQYTRNASVAKAQLSFTENAIEELTELIVKAKELAIGQSSNIFDVSIRKSVAQEIAQLRNQALSIGNRRLGNKYIFSGHKTLTKPFDQKGDYLGDSHQTKIEVSKDVFVPITFSGKNIFFEKTPKTPPQVTPDLSPQPNQSQSPLEFERNLASQDKPLTTPKKKQSDQHSIFRDLQSLENALNTNNHEIIQDLLPKLDKTIDRLIEKRTMIGSTINKIDNSVDSIEKEDLINAEYKSKIEDADVAQLFTDLTRQQNVLNATYKSSAQMMNNSLMRFIN